MAMTKKFTAADHPSACILLNVGRNTRCFSVSDIVRLEACSNYTYIHFINHRPLLIAKVMHLLEEFLQPHGFIRIHRRHVINSSFVIAVDEGKILLQDQSRIPFSRRRKKEVKRFLSEPNHHHAAA
jgi:two-component system, LytTR family, response regulator